MLLDAEFKSINVLHQLSLNSLGFCVLCYSTWYSISSSFLPLTSAGAGLQSQNIDADGLWLLFYGQFQGCWSEKNLVLGI